MIKQPSHKSYGSLTVGETGQCNKSSPHPVHLHPSLDALDLGPHPLRRSFSPSTSQSPGSSRVHDNHDQLGQSRSHHSFMPSAINSPLMRKYSFTSSPGGSPRTIDKSKQYSSSDSYDPILRSHFIKSEFPRSGSENETTDSGNKTSKNESVLYYIIYALVNSIMCIPCLYGYASVIFSHSIFQPHINALSKLVILSSVVHQICFTTFSSLSFSIGQVQDAGLIFLSTMSNKIATRILDEAEEPTDDVITQIVSTTIVLLGTATACLGVILILMGKFRLADVVAYLPLPVVGGYLAFIGYFCLEAGVALCISDTIMKPSDWAQLLDEHLILLAIPGIISGVVLTMISRKCENEAILPIAMVAIPLAFYIVVFGGGWSIEDAREEGWVGALSPPVPVGDLFSLVDFGKVRWDLGKELIPTWLGMVFVVSFSSCLDVAAISMDMGQALDVNNELMTVGISNFVSGCLGGFTGSYIFSQTIFTYRTGCRSRWIGALLAVSFLAVVISTINFLEITPLFFLGSTLIFIGFDLLYEWIVEVRHKLLLSEFFVLLATFIAIQLLGIDGGIGLGIVVAIIDFVFTSASVSSVLRVSRRSSAFYGPKERAFIENRVYNSFHPQIIILEIRGAVFFGSSMQVLSNIVDATGMNVSFHEKAEMTRINSPRSHHSRIRSIKVSESLSPASTALSKDKMIRTEEKNRLESVISKGLEKELPRFLVLDLSSVSNVDASAARGCFLQLAKMCAIRKIVVCAAGANNRIDWMLRTHDTAHRFELEGLAQHAELSQKIILFDDINNALRFCEKTLLAEKPNQGLAFKQFEDLASPGTLSISLSTAFTHFLGVEPEDASLLNEYEKSGKSFHSEMKFKDGETIFRSGVYADGFYVVLSGTVVILVEGKTDESKELMSGAGRKKIAHKHNMIESGQVTRVLSLGSIFGFVDFVLNRQRTFSAVAGVGDALVAKCDREGLNQLKAENPALDRIVDKVLLLCSVIELASHNP